MGQHILSDLFSKYIAASLNQSTDSTGRSIVSEFRLGKLFRTGTLDCFFMP